MAIVMMSEVKGQTPEGYDQVLQHVRDAVERAPGFIAHAAFAAGDSWHLVEIWQSKGDCDAFFVKHIVPFLPEGIRPKRSYHETHALLLPAAS
jgi:heme-degrading monooxygenase HmoA